MTSYTRNLTDPRVGRSVGHEWAVSLATSGHFYWPPMGSSDWPLTEVLKTNPRCENGHTLQANSDVTYPNSDPLVNVDAVLICPHGVHLSKWTSASSTARPVSATTSG